jgi:cell division protein DivIC
LKFLRILFNKYLLTAAGFIVLMLFFDQADWISQKARHKELQDVKDNISYLQKEIDRIDAEYKAIRTRPEALERYAREHYRMKRDSEDLYIVERK